MITELGHFALVLAFAGMAFLPPSLPLFYADGSPTDYDVETSTAADWAYWDSNTESVFAELQQRFDNGWEANAV